MTIAGWDVAFARMRVDELPEILTRYKITTFPRTLLFLPSPYDVGPQRYFKNYGLTAERFLKWLRFQIKYPQVCNAFPAAMVLTAQM